MPKEKWRPRMPSTALNADQMRKIILKLKWIGMDDEAEHLCEALPRPATWLMAPLDTD